MTLTSGMPLRVIFLYVLGEIYRRDGVLTEERVRWLLNHERQYFHLGAVNNFLLPFLQEDSEILDSAGEDNSDAGLGADTGDAGAWDSDEDNQGAYAVQAASAPLTLTEYGKPEQVARRRRVLATKPAATGVAIPEDDAESLLFPQFAEAVIFTPGGIIWWRLVEPAFSTIIMNAYSPDTGRLIAGAFSQLTVFEDGHFDCDCEAFNDIDISHSTDTFNPVEQSGDCFHRMFFERYLIDVTSARTELSKKLAEGMAKAGVRTVEVRAEDVAADTSSSHRVFHTLVDDDDPLGRSEFVHWHASKTRTKIVCQSQTCHHLAGALRSNVTVDQISMLCRHNANVVKDVKDLLSSKIDGAGSDGLADTEGDAAGAGDDAAIPPTDEDVVEVDWRSVYNADTDEWFFHPSDKGRTWRLVFEGEIFHKNMREHRSWGFATHPSVRLENGKLAVHGPDALPDFAAGATCTQCDAAWAEAEIVSVGYVLVRTLHCVVYRDEKALSCKCGKKLAWDAELESIFLSSPAHGMSLDVWFEYAMHPTDFTSSAKILTERYKRSHPNAYPFFDKGVWIDIWFRCATAFGKVMGKAPTPGCAECLAWAEVDENYASPVGADATKLGPIRSNTLLVPIEQPDPLAPAIPQNVLHRLFRGHQRCFVPSVRSVDIDGGLQKDVPEALARRSAYTRVLLNWVATSAQGTFNEAGLDRWLATNKVAAAVHAKFPLLTFVQRMAFLIGDLASLDDDYDAAEIATPGLDDATRRQLLWPLPEVARPLLLRHMLGNDQVASRPWSVFWEVLSKDDSLTMLLPRKVAVPLQAWIQRDQALKTTYPVAIGDTVPSLHDAIMASFVGPAVARVLDRDVVALLRWLLLRVADIRAAELPPEPPLRAGIPGSCNPARDGISYRFTKHGRRVRRQRDFGDKQSEAAGNMRRAPLIEDPTRVWKCGKIFPEVSAKAMTYLFVAMCMLHQTVHGFHMIPGAEGQKDGHAVLYQVEDYFFFLEIPRKCHKVIWA
jgi:hypothetical protein